MGPWRYKWEFEVRPENFDEVAGARFALATSLARLIVQNCAV